VSFSRIGACLRMQIKQLVLATRNHSLRNSVFKLLNVGHRLKSLMNVHRKDANCEKIKTTPCYVRISIKLELCLQNRIQNRSWKLWIKYVEKFLLLKEKINYIIQTVSRHLILRLNFFHKHAHKTELHNDNYSRCLKIDKVSKNSSVKSLHTYY